MVSAQMSAAQMAIVPKMLRMNANAAASIVQVLEAAQQHCRSRQRCRRRRAKSQRRSVVSA
jgi:hypothetical protein